MRSAHSILLDATRKLLELRRDRKWAVELPSRCPPVLWFGNALSPKPKVLTIGANPSRKEFLFDTSTQAIEKVRRVGNESSLSFREPPKNRFRILCGNETLKQTLTSKKLRQQIIDSYNSYFKRPEAYRKWFGDDRDDSYNVEGFLRGFGASYYGSHTIPQQAIHIDLFPFATLSDFNCIKEMATDDLLADGWARRLVGQLIEFLAPTVLVLFGRANWKSFGKHIDCSVASVQWQSSGQGEFFVRQSEQFGLTVVGLSTNLGNPRGFTALQLREYGKRIRRLINSGRY